MADTLQQLLPSASRGLSVQSQTVVIEDETPPETSSGEQTQTATVPAADVTTVVPSQVRPLEVKLYYLLG